MYTLIVFVRVRTCTPWHCFSVHIVVVGTPMPSISRDVISTSYDKQGYERCDVLFANPLSSDRASWRDAFDTDPLASMDRAILGMRFKEWKPIIDSNNTVNVPTKTQDLSRSYCYLFNSNAAANIQDPFLQGLTCSLNDVQKLGGGREFITNVFADNTQDAPHASRVSYDKCVFEIDSTRMTSSNLASFWKSLSDAECAAYKARWEGIIKGLDVQIATASSTLQHRKNLRDNEIFTLSNLKSYWSQYSSCMDIQQGLNRDLANIRTQQSNLDCTFQGTYANKTCTPAGGGKPHKALLDERLAQANTTFAVKRNQRSALNATATDLTAEVSSLQARSNDLSQRFKDTSDQYSVCMQVDIPSLQARKLLLNQNIYEVTTKRDQTLKSLEQVNLNLKTLMSSNDTLNKQETKLKGDLTQVQRNLITCTADLERLDTLAKRAKEEYERYWKLSDECTNDVHELNQRLAALKAQIDNLIVEREEWWAWCRRKQTEEIGNIVTQVDSDTNEVISNADSTCQINSYEMQNIVAKRQEKAQALAQLQNATQGTKSVDANWCKANISRVVECCR